MKTSHRVGLSLHKNESADVGSFIRTMVSRCFLVVSFCDASFIKRSMNVSFNLRQNYAILSTIAEMELSLLRDVN